MTTSAWILADFEGKFASIKSFVTADTLTLINRSEILKAMIRANQADRNTDRTLLNAAKLGAAEYHLLTNKEKNYVSFGADYLTLPTNLVRAAFHELGIRFKKIAFRYALFCCLGIVSLPLVAGEPKPIWLTSAGFTLKLGVNDKLMNETTYSARYIVRSQSGLSFVAEKKGSAVNAAYADATFPEDFHEQKSGQKAWAGCDDGKYIWEIYVNGSLIDSGFIECKRTKRTTKQ